MTRTELDAMTAKALRPIASGLGITGASRMRKDDLISAIIAAEAPKALPMTPERQEKADLINQAYGAPALQQTPSADNSEVRTALTPPPAQYFARRTRRGTETVVVEREVSGRTYFRVIDSTTGRRSAPYNMRSIAFRSQYVAVPS